jgi:hypothetical protein
MHLFSLIPTLVAEAPLPTWSGYIATSFPLSLTPSRLAARGRHHPKPSAEAKVRAVYAPGRSVSENSKPGKERTR